MQSSSEQPLVGEERYLTTLITAAKETMENHAYTDHENNASVNSSGAHPPPGNHGAFAQMSVPGAGH